MIGYVYMLLGIFLFYALCIFFLTLEQIKKLRSELELYSQLIKLEIEYVNELRFTIENTFEK